MVAPIGLEWLDELTAALKATPGIRSVALDPAELEPLPGVLVRVTGFDPDVLAGFTATADLFVVTTDQHHERALRELVPLANAVLERIDPAGPIAAATVQLPDGGGRLPALLIPYDDTTQATPESESP
jgi:hypothetical protein